MKLLIPVSVALCIAGIATSAASAASPDRGEKQFISVKKSEIKWKDEPAIGRGAKSALIDGDPKGTEPFTMRFKVPPNTKIGVHTHPADENITVLEGTLHFATGENFDPKKATAYNAGDGFIVPKGVPMYAFTKDKPAMIQLNGRGPWGIDYKDAADDPMKRTRK